LTGPQQVTPSERNPIRSARYMPDRWTLPELSPENAQFFTSGEIRLQHCLACGHVQHPPVAICASCQSTDFEYRAGSRTGVIESFTIVHHPVHPMLVDRVPYNVIVVALDEPAGVRIVGNLVGGEGQSMAVGVRVSATWADVDTDEVGGGGSADGGGSDRRGDTGRLLLPQWEALG
jgi:uncharacterized protein